MKKIANKGFWIMLSIGIIILLVGVGFGVLADNNIFSSALIACGFTMTTLGVILIVKGKNPEYMKQELIELNDERNIHVREKASSVAWIVGIVTFPILTIVFGYMENYIALALVFGSYLLQVLCFILAMALYKKKM